MLSLLKPHQTLIKGTIISMRESRMVFVQLQQLISTSLLKNKEVTIPPLQKVPRQNAFRRSTQLRKMILFKAKKTLIRGLKIWQFKKGKALESRFTEHLKFIHCEKRYGHFQCDRAMRRPLLLAA